MTRPRRQPETDLIRAVLEYLKLKGCFAWRNSTGAMRNESGRLLRFGIVGASDILGVAPDGRAIAIETKVGRNKPSQYQLDFLDAIWTRGGIGLVVYPENFTEVIDKALAPRGEVWVEEHNG